MRCAHGTSIFGVREDDEVCISLDTPCSIFLTIVNLKYSGVWQPNMRTIQAILVACLTLLLVACTAPPEDSQRATFDDHDDDRADLSIAASVPINFQESTFVFEGYGPGKSHEGTFDGITGSIFLQDGGVVGFAGVIDPSTVSTGIERLDGHLKNEDFFDIENYPTITFSSYALTQDGTALTGNLTFLGVTRPLTFPVTIEGARIMSDFVFDASQFGMSYTGVNDEVRIAFDLVGQVSDA